MLKRSFNRLFLVGEILALLGIMTGCTMIKGPLYPDTIYNNRQPLISVTYEYGEIEVRLPLNYIGAIPDNIMFEVYAQGDTINPIISILQEAPRVFLVYLPQGVLDIHEKANLIRIIPQDSNFQPVDVRFQGIRFGQIQLPPKSIGMKQLIVSGKVFLNKNGNTLAGVDVSFQNFDNVIKEIRTNESGNFQLAIPGEYRYAKHLRLVSGNNLIFKPFKKMMDFSESFRQIVNIGVGPSSTMEEPLYVTNRDNVHFRKHPDIGSETLFLLERGEAISVKRVTPGEYQGSIEVSLGHDKNINLDGWIYRSDVILLDVNNIFKNEPTNDSTL
jgi:hypothetical protein